MRIVRNTLGVLVAGIFIFSTPIVLVPMTAYAQTPLVVCGMSGRIGAEQNDATGCQACHLFELIDRLIKFLIILAIPIASILFAYAGFKYFVGGVAAHTEAIGIFRDVLLGFVIALCGFLIVDTIIKTLVNGSFTGPSWKTVQCVSGSARQIANGGIGFEQLPNTGGLVNTDSAPGPAVDPKVGSGDCSVGGLTSSFGADAAKMSCVCANESGGNPLNGSWIDKTAGGSDSFSYGLFQLNLTVHYLTDCSTGQKVNCPSAFAGKDSKSTVVNRDLYNQCVGIATNAACNIANAKSLAYDRPGGGLQHWGNLKNAGSCGVPRWNASN